MKKLVTALIIVLPLILLVALFAITGIARISADIPVSGIVINNRGNDGVFVLDIADYSSPVSESDLGVEVQPLTAKNRDYTLSIVDSVSGETSNVVTKDKDGTFRLHDVGEAKLIFTTCDGGYSGSVIFRVIASGATDFAPVISDRLGNTYGLSIGTAADYAVKLISGNYTLGGSFRPVAAYSVHASYESSNPHIVDFNGSNGEFIAKFGGTAVVKMSVESTAGILEKTVEVTVEPSAVITIDGGDALKGQARVSASLKKNTVRFALQTQKNIRETDIAVSSLHGLKSFGVSAVDGIENAFYITLETEAFDVPTSVPYTLVIDGAKYRFYVDYADYKISIYAPTAFGGSEDIVTASGSALRLIASIQPYDALTRYSWNVEEQSVFEIASQSGDTCFVKANGIGEVTLSMTWTAYDENGNAVAEGIETRRLISVQCYSSLIFAEVSDTYGMGGFAIASEKYENGRFFENSYTAKFQAYDRSGKLIKFEDIDFENIEFSASDGNLAEVSRDAGGVYLHARGTGSVSVYANWKYKDLFGLSGDVSFTFTAVDGVLASDDSGLRAAYAQKRAAVLAEDIYLGENLFNVTADGKRTPKYGDAEMREKLLEYTGEIYTTADWMYYKNIGETHPRVRYCLDITADMYGNGHSISAEYITNMLDSTDTLYDFALFRGPLDFVATQSEGIKLAAVKGQDNIVFLVRTDGVTIDNAVLKGCDDKTLYDSDGGMDLSLLNNMGTVLEIMSNAAVTNSRVKNGRTVLRAFGRYGIDEDSYVDAAIEKINVTVDGCELQNAREFLLKIGTNRILRGTAKDPSPPLMDANGNVYDRHNSSACDAYIDDSYFMSNYVLTEVALKDSVLRTSGLFAIGVESHFSGPMLARDDIFNLVGWDNLAGTSYPALLRLIGNVVIADWKEISSVDSSTLIESNSQKDSLSFLTLNIAEMLKTVQTYDESGAYTNLIAKANGKSYAHGGIAFYGGGKNYSVLDTSKYTFEKMNQYIVNLSILTKSPDDDIKRQGGLLPFAAGIEDFRFVMFDATSNFSYNTQTA